VNHLLGAFQAEIISCLHGIQEAIMLGISNLILETDALQVKQLSTHMIMMPHLRVVC
jgi:hypothetical protein